jgi:hypothetical protein
MIPPDRPPSYAMAFIVRQRCRMKYGKQVGDRVANKELATLERDARITAAMGFQHLGISTQP